MQRFRRLLVVADELGAESPAYVRALELARRGGAQVTLIDTLHLDDSGIGAGADEVGRELADWSAADRRAELAELVRPAREGGVPVAVRVLVGTPFLEVVREVLRNGHDLVLRTVRPPRGVVERFFTSFDVHLLRKCPCPVWMLKGGERPSPRRVLAALDLAPGDDGRQALNRRVLELATALVQLDGGELHVVHAWTLPGEGALRHRRAVYAGINVNALLREERERRVSRLGALLDGRAPDEPRPVVHIVKGFPDREIPAAVERLGVDAVVMGTVARTGIPGFIMGNTAEDILSQLRCSVLAVKPPGWETPVRPGPVVAGGTALRSPHESDSAPPAPARNA